MATAYASSSSANNNGATTVVLTKPTGLAEGDLMIAALGQLGTNNLFSLTGWTSLGSSVAGDDALTILWKIADSSDAAASNFTFTSATNAVALGGLLRITGTSFTGAANLSIDIDLENPSTATPSFASSLVPPGDSSLLIMGMFIHDTGGDNHDITGYAVTNSNPTWTERVSVDNSGSDCDLEIATASFTPTTTPGAYSMAVGSPALVAGQTYGFIIGVKETTSVSVSPNPISLTASVQSSADDGFAVTGGASVTTTVISLSSSVPSPTITTATPDWINTDKSSPGSITNTPKS